MRVLLINQTFYPDVAATAQHAHDLARHLVEQGHEVEAIASTAIYGEKGATLPPSETVDNIEIRRVGKCIFGKSSTLGRLVDFAIFYVCAAFRALTTKRPDVVICFTTPPFIALVGLLVRGLRGAKFIYWVMDMYPEVPVALGMMKPRSPVTRFLRRLDALTMRKADRVVVLGRCMFDRVRERGVPAERVTHIDVWADHTEVDPTREEVNSYRSEWNLDGAFVVMYSGNIGLAHEIETLCDAARLLRDDERIRFVIVGGGKRKQEIEDCFKRDGIDGVIAPYQPRERLDSLLTCADVHLVSLKPGFEGLVVPCKLFGIMAAARPSVFIGNPDSEIARVILENDCGLITEPGDGRGLAAELRRMAAEPDRVKAMGERGRRALIEKYDRRHACTKWQRLLEEIIHTARPAAQAPADSRHPTADSP